jgi:hypothetical protein
MCETNSASDVLEHCGCQIRLSQSGLEWMAFVALLKQCPALIMAPDHHAAIAKAMSILSFSRPLIRALHDLQPDSTRTRRL